MNIPKVTVVLIDREGVGTSRDAMTEVVVKITKPKRFSDISPVTWAKLHGLSIGSIVAQKLEEEMAKNGG